MNLLNIRYLLSREIGLAISIISIAISLITLLIIIKPENKKCRLLICEVVITLTIFLFINVYLMKDYEKIPNVETLDIDLAKQTLYELGFENVYIKEKDKKTVSDEYRVESQSVESKSIIRKDVEIILTCISDKTTSNDNDKNANDNETAADSKGTIKQEDDSGNEDTQNNTTDDLSKDMNSSNDNDTDTETSDNGYKTNDSMDDVVEADKKEDIKIENTQDPVSNTSHVVDTSNNNTNDLMIVIDDYEFFSDGFHYRKLVSENTFNVVDYEQGISGHFSYSRELTDTEYEKWTHGGKLLDESGEECGFANSFFQLLMEYSPLNYLQIFHQEIMCMCFINILIINIVKPAFHFQSDF